MVAPLAAEPRPTVRGPFLFAGERKLTVKGVTYGTFAADPSGDLFPPRDVVRQDFARMRAAHVNTVRTYTPPPDWLLEEARAAGLRVLVGIYWDCRNCEFDEPRLLKSAIETVRQAVRRCRRFPDVVLGYSIANEIPPLTVRLHGRRVVERFLEKLFLTAKAEDPEGLVTYANYPTTEFLELDFLDFHTLNVYLLEPRTLGAYLDRMLIQVKGKPLVLGEVGDDSLRKGKESQASLLDWTIPLALDKGLAGVFVFGWTDEWVVGGHRVDDWHFGLVDHDRQPKPALDVVRRRFAESPSARHAGWPRVSVVVCNYNGGSTLDETLRSLVVLDYPDYEIVYVDDGSTDDSLAIARRFEGRVRIIAQENRGLSAARNVGAEAATGTIVAYTDSDAFADRDWLRQLVLTMQSGDFVAAGGPNLTPESDGLVAQLIAVCPGNPTYVLKDNVEADHIAGVNMAFRRDVLLGLGGFDPIHTRAGDDVDVCWRLEDAGLRIAFSPTAIVWHHRRPSIQRYLSQQYGYGEAENQLEAKHPERFNLGGYIRWRGRVYVAFKHTSALFKPFIYHGRLGMAMFQTLYQKDPSYLMYGPSMIHWYLVWITLFLLSPLSIWLFAGASAMCLLSIWVAFVAGWTTEVPVALDRRGKVRKVATVAWLHFLHPLVRWWGRVVPRRRAWSTPASSERLPWSQRLRELRFFGPRPKELRRYWGIGGQDRETLLRALHAQLKSRGESASHGQEWVNWDLHLDGGFLADGHVYTAPEHYDQALCFGFLARTAPPARWGFLALCAAAAWLSWQDPWFLLVWLVPVALLAAIVSSKAWLRWAAWSAIEVVVAQRGAKRFERKQA